MSCSVSAPASDRLATRFFTEPPHSRRRQCLHRSCRRRSARPCRKLRRLGRLPPQGSGGTPGAGYAPSAVCTPQAPRRKKRGWKIALAVGLPLVLLGGGFLGYSLYAWNEIETAQAYEQYTQAYEWYERAPWLWELDEQRGQYTAAWVLVERGELSEAAQAFRELGDYADSGELAEKCNTYIRAQTVGSPFTKYKLYNNLGGFLDSSRQAQAQIPEIYDTALEHYGENRFSAAMEWLEIIPDYETTKTLLFMWKRVRRTLFYLKTITVKKQGCRIFLK